MQDTSAIRGLNILNIIRRYHDVYRLTGDEFAALAQAIGFYVKGGFDDEQVAQLAMQDCFPMSEEAMIAAGLIEGPNYRDFAPADDCYPEDVESKNCR